jgi:hypothetical protein
VDATCADGRHGVANGDIAASRTGRLVAARPCSGIAVRAVRATARVAAEPMRAAGAAAWTNEGWGAAADGADEEPAARGPGTLACAVETAAGTAARATDATCCVAVVTVARGVETT